MYYFGDIGLKLKQLTHFILFYFAYGCAIWIANRQCILSQQIITVTVLVKFA